MNHGTKSRSFLLARSLQRSMSHPAAAMTLRAWLPKVGITNALVVPRSHLDLQKLQYIEGLSNVQYASSYVCCYLPFVPTSSAASLRHMTFVSNLSQVLPSKYQSVAMLRSGHMYRMLCSNQAVRAYGHASSFRTRVLSVLRAGELWGRVHTSVMACRYRE